MHSITFFVTLIVILQAFANAHTSKTISASVKDTQVDGVEGLNLQWSAPFKFRDYVVGFKTNLCNLKKGPEEFFARKSYETDVGTATVDASYNLASRTTNIASKWVSDRLGLTLLAEGDTKEHLREVGLETSRDVKGNKLNLEGHYNLIDDKISGRAELNVEDTAVEISYDNQAKDPVLAVSHKVNDRNSVNPSVSLKNGAMKYGWTRKWNGGSLESELTPGNKVSLTWKDNGANGAWTTKADIPLEDQSNTKVSFSRDWNY